MLSNRKIIYRRVLQILLTGINKICLYFRILMIYLHIQHTYSKLIMNEKAEEERQQALAEHRMVI